MLRQVFIPTESRASIAMPREWFGHEVEVIAFPVIEQKPLRAHRSLSEKRTGTFTAMRLHTKDWHFDREEANAR
jgi:hypothetical protein